MTKAGDAILSNVVHHAPSFTCLYVVYLMSNPGTKTRSNWSVERIMSILRQTIYLLQYSSSKHVSKFDLSFPRDVIIGEGEGWFVVGEEKFKALWDLRMLSQMRW
jgi:hypothetical protein